MRACRTVALFVFALLLAACGVAVPADKAAYVGQWNAEGMSLLITRDGSIQYNRLRKGAKTSINGPLKGFVGEDFEVGIGPMTTTFKVATPPHQVDGQWRMTVDGVELTRIDGMPVNP
jgi:hypothetical protein